MPVFARFELDEPAAGSGLLTAGRPTGCAGERAGFAGDAGGAWRPERAAVAGCRAGASSSSEDVPGGTSERAGEAASPGTSLVGMRWTTPWTDAAGGASGCRGLGAGGMPKRGSPSSEGGSEGDAAATGAGSGAERGLVGLAGAGRSSGSLLSGVSSRRSLARMA